MFILGNNSSIICLILEVSHRLQLLSFITLSSTFASSLNSHFASFVSGFKHVPNIPSFLQSESKKHSGTNSSAALFTSLFVSFTSSSPGMLQLLTEKNRRAKMIKIANPYTHLLEMIISSFSSSIFSCSGSSSIISFASCSTTSFSLVSSIFLLRRSSLISLISISSFSSSIFSCSGSSSIISSLTSFSS